MGCTGPCNQGREECAHPDECDAGNCPRITPHDIVADLLIATAILCNVAVLCLLLLSR